MPSSTASTSTTPDLEIEVFRSGDYGPKGTFTEADLETLAADYDAREHEAPVTLDHQQSGPAHGWVKKLRRIGDRLVATLASLSPALAKALETQRYKKRSVELYRAAPNTGRPALKAVSFLGAAVPEVKGLADPAFSESITFEEAAPDHAAAARERLQRAGVWKPAWEQAGLCDVFSELGTSPQAEALLQVLETQTAAAPFGVLEREAAAPLRALYFSDALTGDAASAESRRHHLRALEILCQQPTLSYREALLLASV